MKRDEFSDQMWLTYKTRFNTHARLLLQNTLYSIVTTTLSIFIIVINLLQLLPDLLIINQAMTTCYTISLSIIILVINIVFVSSDKKREAEKFHSCALEIQEIHREYTMRNNTLTDNEIKEYINRYNKIFSKYGVNHSTSDYIKVKITSEGTKIEFIKFYIQRFFIYYFLLIVLLICPILFGILILIQ